MLRNSLRLFSLAVLSLSVSAFPVFAQQPGPVPQSSVPAPVAEDGKASALATIPPADYSAQAAVIERLETIYHFEADGTGTKTDRVVVRVQTEAGVQQLGSLRLGYSSANQKLKIGYVRVRKADGTVVTAGDSAVQDLSGPVARIAPMYTDYREKHITVPSLRPGDKLEYEAVTETTTPLAAGQFWMEHDFNDDVIILEETLTVDVPRSRQVFLKVLPDFKDYKTVETGDRRSYTWQYKNLTTSTQREQAEKDKDPGKKPKKKKNDDTSSVQLTTFTSWSEMGAWYSKLEQERQQPSAEIKAKALELTKGLKTDGEKVQALYNYVALTYRYISLSFGVGRYQPHAAAEVFKNEYGDCKDKHTLLASMLRSLGYHPNTVLIHSQHKLDEEVPSPSQFDHVIGNVTLGDKTIWLDTTSEVAPMGMLILPLRAKAAVQIAPDAKTTIVHTPPDIPLNAFNTFELTGKVTELGRLEGHVTRTMRGDVEIAMRAAFRAVPQERWKMVIEYANNVEGIGGKVSTIKTSNLADTSVPLVWEYDLEVPNFFDWTAKDSKFSLPMPHFTIPDLDEDDTDPAILGGPTVYTSRVKITIPPSIKLTVPVPVSVKRDYAEYSGSASLKDGVLTAERVLRVGVHDVPPARARDMAAFVRVLRSDEQQQALAQLSGDAAATATKQASAEELEQAASNAFSARNYQLSVSLYDQLTQKDPKHARAWIGLGLAYGAMGQYAKAEAAFKKQIEVNPYDEYSYNYLGQIYASQERWDDAIQQYRKQLEVNPLDGVAHGNLGAALVRQRHYAEAVPELQAAVQINPDNAFMQQLLGEAYLKSGKVDDAMSTWDRALEKAPEPIIWNNIAYVLACEKQRLDRAEQYAESAVSSTSALLRNLSADQADWRGAAVSGQLATYWDTLGWVYFQKGDLDKAEKFLSASWSNTQHGEVGDHLAQLYAKRGERDKAIDVYVASISGRHAAPDTRDHLKELVKDDKKLERILAEKRPSALNRSTVPLNWHRADGTAEVALILDNKGEIEQVHFVSGGKEFENETAELKKTKLPLILPDSSTSRFVRKGVIRCLKQNCQLMLAPADEDVQNSLAELTEGQ